MFGIQALDPQVWYDVLLSAFGSPLFYIVVGIIVLYIVLNSKAVAALFGRKKKDD